MSKSVKEEVAVGMDGCVYKPAFSCIEGHNYPEKQYISKLMRDGKPKAKQEIDNYKNLKLHEIDPDMHYFISNPELCSLTKDDIKGYMQSKRECNNVVMPYSAINYLDNGTDLYKIMSHITDIYQNNTGYVSLKDINNYLFGLNNVFQGVLLLHENGIYHLDIKPDNMVIDTTVLNADFKLIDFAMSRTNANPPTSTYGTATYIPPEMYMFASKKYTLQNRYDEYLNEHNTEFPPSQFPLLNYYEDLPDRKKYEKADVWALGMTLLDFYNIILIGNYSLKRMEIYHELKHYLIDKMLKINIDQRLSIEQAADFYNDYLIRLSQEPEDKKKTFKSLPAQTTSQYYTYNGGKKYKNKKSTRKNHI